MEKSSEIFGETVHYKKHLSGRTETHLLQLCTRGCGGRDPAIVSCIAQPMPATRPPP